MQDWQFYRHMPVYCHDGRRLGHTEEIGHAVDYLHVREGRILVRDWYIPIEAVEDVTAGGVHLRVDRPDLRRSGWNVPAWEYLAHQGATPGYDYTSKADIPASGERHDSGASSQA